MGDPKKISRRKYTAEFALKAMQENKTLPELGSKHQPELENHGINKNVIL